MARKHRLRTSRFLPNSETLESRTLLSANIGVNLPTNRDYNNDEIWTDVHNIAFPWEAPTTTMGYAANDTAIPLTSDNYPLAPAATSFDLVSYPDGAYQFSFTGSATVSFSDIGVLSGPVTVSGGVSSGTVIVNHKTGDGQYLVMQVSGLSSANPMGNFHLMMPGYGNGTTPAPMYTPQFLATLAPFSTIRFVNWDGGNNTSMANWSDRVAPTNFLTDGANGVPYEDIVELANESQKDIWLDIPALATPTFVQNLAQLVATKLDPNLNVYVEYSNETWNSVTMQYGQILAAAKLNSLVTQSTNQLQMIEQQTAYQTVNIGQAFKTAFGANSANVRPILGGQATWSLMLQYALQFVQQNYGSPSQYIYATAEAPYVNIASSYNVSGMTLNQLFAGMNAYLSGTLIPALQANATLSAQYGLPMVAYEGGQGITSTPSLNDNALIAQALNDPRMYQMQLALMSAWQQLGGGLFDYYTLDQVPTTNYIYGYYGLLGTVNSPGSQSFNAMMSLLLPGGDANLDGTVNYPDFQLVAANYGLTNAFWRQGDFNDDGTVNWQDLNILKQNLNPAGFTLSQFAQAAVFGQLSTVVPGQSLEYDGYGVTYASALPFASSSGTLKLNTNYQGSPITLGGVSYNQGIGGVGNTSVSFAINGAQTRFESTIGVDGSSNSSAAVIFSVYGDGTLLYQSPTMTYASGGVPIDINIAGVKTLSLYVTGAPGSVVSSDHAVWADARLISTANFGSVSPYTMMWQLSQNGTVVSTQTTDSFTFGALSGTYTLALTVTDSQGNTGTASTVVTVVPTPTATYLYEPNTSTKGNWQGRGYGTQGYEIFGGPTSIPNYATVSASGQSLFTWSASTSSPQALDIDNGPYGIATCWYASSTFSVNVNMVDGQTHDLSVYAVDYENAGRTEQIQILNATTGAVLDTRVISSFTGGIYLQWEVSGNVTIKVTCLAGPNAVLSGMFFDPPTTTMGYLTEKDSTTQGDWVGTYGAQGYDLATSSLSLPSYASISMPGASPFVWASTTSDIRALQNTTGTSRLASCWYGNSSLTVDVNLTDGQVHQLALYFVDYEPDNRHESITVTSALTGAVLDTESLSSFSQGVYLDWAVLGSVVITITNTGGPNVVLSGIFIDPVNTATGLGSASYFGPNTSTQGNWIGMYGSQGYDMVNTVTATSLPSYATISTIGASTNTWSTSTTSASALQAVGGQSRVAAAWYAANSFTVDVFLTDNKIHDLELYFLDWQNAGRKESITITNAGTGAVLDTETISSFSNGTYLSWAVSGDIAIKFTCLGGPNAVLSGIFLDPQYTSATPSAATLVGNDTTTAGSWIGKYGSQGYDLIDNAVSLPSSTAVIVTGATTYVWSSNTTDKRALQTPSGSSRIAATWYSSSSFSVDVNVSDGQVHQVAFYFVDWDAQNRAEKITVSNPATGAALATSLPLAATQGGIYILYNVQGNVLFTFTRTGGPNAILSGIFIDPSTSASNFVAGNSTTSPPVSTTNVIGSYGLATSAPPVATHSQLTDLALGTLNASTNPITNTGVGLATNMDLVPTTNKRLRTLFGGLMA